jgi:serine/threonine protein phosphatase PrpC
MAPLHNVRCNAQERSAAIARGARYVGGYLEDERHPGYGLQVARSLGDQVLDSILLREPEILSYELGKDSFVLVGTDGLLDSFDTDLQVQVDRLANLIRGGADAQDLVNDALARQTQDNVSVILWRAS